MPDASELSALMERRSAGHLGPVFHAPKLPFAEVAPERCTVPIRQRCINVVPGTESKSRCRSSRPMVIR